MEKFNLEHWWKAATGAGVAMAVGAAAIGHNALLLIGVGFLCFGIGEWINRPIQQDILGGGRAVVTGYPWRPIIFGLALDAVGIVLFFVGVYRLVFP